MKDQSLLIPAAMAGQLSEGWVHRWTQCSTRQRPKAEAPTLADRISEAGQQQGAVTRSLLYMYALALAILRARNATLFAGVCGPYKSRALHHQTPCLRILSAGDTARRGSSVRERRRIVLG